MTPGQVIGPFRTYCYSVGNQNEVIQEVNRGVVLKESHRKISPFECAKPISARRQAVSVVQRRPQNRLTSYGATVRLLAMIKL